MSANRNWILVLGLKFDPVEHDEIRIRSALGGKRKAWAKGAASIGSNRGYCQSLLDNYDSIEKAVLDRPSRTSMAKEAKSVVYGQLTTILNAAAEPGGAKRVGEDKAERIATLLREWVRGQTGVKDWDCSVDAMRVYAKKLGYTFVARPKSLEDASFETFESMKGGAVYKALDDSLANFGFKDIYSFAQAESSASAHAQDGKVLLSWIERRCNAQCEGGPHNQIKTDAETILNKAREILETPEKKKAYDEYLQWRDADIELSRLKACTRLRDDETVTSEMLETCVNRVSFVLADASRAWLIVRGFCRKHRLRLVNGASQGASGGAGAAAGGQAFGGGARTSQAGQGAGAAAAAGIGKVGRRAPAWSRDVQIIDVCVYGDQLVMQLEAPPDAVAFVFLIRRDTFASGINDTTAGLIRKQVSGQIYDQHAGKISFDYDGSREYWISVYTVFGSATNPSYSKGAQYHFKDDVGVYYQVERVDRRHVKVKFWGSRSSFLLPETKIFYKKGSPPKYPGDGKEVRCIPKLFVKGEWSISIELPKMSGASFYLTAMPADPSVKEYVSAR